MKARWQSPEAVSYGSFAEVTQQVVVPRCDYPKPVGAGDSLTFNNVTSPSPGLCSP